MAVEIVQVINTKTGGRGELPVTALELPDFADWRRADELERNDWNG